jgi:hypothetical protein
MEVSRKHPSKIDQECVSFTSSLIVSYALSSSLTENIPLMNLLITFCTHIHVVNINQTKIFIFRNSELIHDDYKWYYTTTIMIYRGNEVVDKV